MLTHLRKPLAPLLLVGALLLGACTGGDDGGSDAAPDELADRLAAAKAVIDEAETVDVSLATDAVPDGVSGLLSAKGQANHDPAFTGDVTVSTGGASLSAEVVAVEGTVYAKTSFAPTFLTIDPATLGAPDPATLVAPDTGLTSLLVQTEDLAAGDRSRDGEEVLTSITGSLPGSVVAGILPSADTESAFEVTYRLTEDDELQDAVITGPFYGDGGDVTYTVTLDTSDEPVDITAPTRGGAR